MCIGVLIPPGMVIDENIIRLCMTRNPDGNGIAYINKKGIVESEKSIDFSEGGKAKFISRYYELARQKHTAKHPMLLHFRVATQGAISQNNCHPFKVKGGVLIHNGTLFYSTNGRWAEQSDTGMFAERYGEKLSHEFVEEHKEQLGIVLGHNKLAFLYDGGMTSVINEKNWDKSKDGVLFSNTGWYNR